MTTIQELQKDISQEERAIRLLTGKIASERKKLETEEAKLKLEKARLKRLDHVVVVGKKLDKSDRFPDVSNNNAVVDVQAVHQASVIRVGDLMVTKISEGTQFVDRPGLVRAKAMRAAGFPRRGFYSFLHPSESGKDQALFFLSTLDSAGIKLLPSDIVIGDGEVTDGQPSHTVAQCFADFGHEIKNHHKGVRWLYGGGPFAAEQGLTLDGYDDHWLAAFVDNPSPFMHFGKRTKAWQHTDGRFGPSPHSCPGIGPCDLSVVLR